MNGAHRDPSWPKVRTFHVLLVLGAVGFGVAASSFFWMYRAERRDEMEWLEGAAESQARTFEAVAAFDSEFSAQDNPGGSFGATLSQMEAAHLFEPGRPKAVRIYLVSLQKDTVAFLLGPHGEEPSDVSTGRIPPELAGVLRKALLGDSGSETVKTRDGRTLLVAFRPVEVPGQTVGMAATLDRAAIWGPFFLPGLIVGCTTLLLVMVAGMVAYHLARPVFEALRASESKYRHLFEHAPDMLLSVSPIDDAIRECNPAFQQMTGYRRSEVIGEPFSSFVADPPSPDAIRERQQALLSSGRSADLDLELRRKDGSSIPVSANAVVVRDETGGAAAIRFSLRDITSRRRTEEALAESEANFRALFQDAPLAYQSLDKEGRFLEINRAYTEAFGYERKDVLGRSFSEIMTPESRSGFEERFQGFRERGHIESVEYELVRKDGETRVVAIDGRIRGDVASGDLRTHCILTDITEEREAKEALRKSQERLLLAQAVGRVGLLDRDLVNGLEIWSDTTYEILGLEPGTVTPGPEARMEVIHPEDRSQAVRCLDRVVTMDDSVTQEYRIVHPSGEIRWVQEIAKVFPTPEGKPTGRILTTIQDITQEVRSKKTLEASQGRLRALAARLTQIREEERKAVARELHDELGQALTSLRMDLDMASSRVPPGHEELRGRLANMIEATDENIACVQELSNRLRPTILDVMGLGPAVEWLVDDLRDRTKLRFHMDLAEERVPLPEDVRIALYRVAQEALTNVVRHAEAKNVWLRLEGGSSSVLLEVEDDGRGFPKETLRSIDSLGMLGMRERALAIGGELTVEERRGGGTTIRLQVPMA